MGIVIERVTGEAAKKVGMANVRPGIYAPTRFEKAYAPTQWANIVSDSVNVPSVRHDFGNTCIVMPSGEVVLLASFVSILKGNDTVSECDVSDRFHPSYFVYVCSYEILMSTVRDRIVKNLTL